VKSKQELSKSAKKAVSTRLDNQLNRLTPGKCEELKLLVAEYYSLKHSIDFMLDISTIIFHECRKTTLRSFSRHGDANYLSNEIKRNYIGDDGIPLDIQAMFASNEYGIHITELDFIDFMVSNPFGKHSFYKNEVVETVKAQIKEYTGFYATHKVIEAIDNKLNNKQIANYDDLPF
jgi:hypothetical protein